MLKCSFCVFTTEGGDEELTKHTIKHHRYEKGFLLKCAVCGKSYSKVNSYYQHQRRHPGSSGSSTTAVIEESSSGDAISIPSAESCGSDTDTDSELDQDDNFFLQLDVPESEDLESVVYRASSGFVSSSVSSFGDTQSLEEQLQNKALKFLFHVRENCQATQRAVDEKVKGVESLLCVYNNVLKTKLLEEAMGGNVSEESINKVFLHFDGQSIFEGAQTAYHRNKLGRSKWKSLIKPSKIVLKTEPTLVNGVVKEVPIDFGYVVPFLEQLEDLLQNNDVLSCVDNPRPSEDSVFRNVLDDSVYRTHPSVILDPKTLAIILFVDDIMPGNPLAGNYTQKLRTYYWTLCNVYPELRSSLRAINILSLVKADVAKAYKNKPFLSGFVDGINRLSSREGVTFIIKGKPRIFHGILLFCVGDIPASANLGCFKESPAFAFSPCRHCLANKHDLYWHFEAHHYVLRSKAMHARHIEALKAFREGRHPLADEEEEENVQDNVEEPAARDPSVEYGINDESILMSVNDADITIILVEDIMHLLAEGILPLVITLILKDSTRQGLSLEYVNSSLQGLDYGHMRKDKPSIIKREYLYSASGVKQKAARMFMLAPLILFVVKDYCAFEKRRLLFLLLLITDMCLSREISVQEVNRLSELIREFLKIFKTYFPNNMIPKMHFLIHLPRQILQFGPLIQQWAMRFEGFHVQLKRLAKIIHNMKDAPFSLVIRMLCKRSNEMESSNGKFLYAGHEDTVSGKASDLPEEYMRALVSLDPCFVEAADVEILTKVSVHGNEYAARSIIVMDIAENCAPILGAVLQMYKYASEYILLCRGLNVTYSCSVNAYKFDMGSELRALKVKDLVFPFALLVILHNGVDYALVNHISKLIEYQYQHIQGCPGC